MFLWKCIQSVPLKEVGSEVIDCNFETLHFFSSPDTFNGICICICDCICICIWCSLKRKHVMWCKRRPCWWSNTCICPLGLSKISKRQNKDTFVIIQLQKNMKSCRREIILCCGWKINNVGADRSLWKIQFVGSRVRQSGENSLLSFSWYSTLGEEFFLFFDKCSNIQLSEAQKKMISFSTKLSLSHLPSFAISFYVLTAFLRWKVETEFFSSIWEQFWG